MKKQTEALHLLEDALKELESSKGSVLTAVQKISRAALILEEEAIYKWCQIQLGEQTYTLALRSYTNALMKLQKENTEPNLKKYKECCEKLDELGLEENTHYCSEELNTKYPESGGGYANIGFVEEKYADLVRRKTGNDGTYYKTNLHTHMVYVRKKAHELSTLLHNRLKFAGTVGNCFDILKKSIDDKLLDLDPALAEQLMLSFKSISSEKKEEWSQSLTTCRRLIEGLADKLQPASEETVNGRTLKQGQYVNRLWAFMDSSIESETNKELAKAHVDFLGSWLEKVTKLAHKGVHAEVEQLEAIKAVFHTYLVIADILEYLDTDIAPKKEKPEINKASIDELEALLGVTRNVAKEIFKFRLKEGCLDCATLATVSGVGPKTVKKAKEEFEIEE